MKRKNKQLYQFNTRLTVRFMEKCPRCEGIKTRCQRESSSGHRRCRGGGRLSSVTPGVRPCSVVTRAWGTSSRPGCCGGQNLRWISRGLRIMPGRLRGPGEPCCDHLSWSWLPSEQTEPALILSTQVDSFIFHFQTRENFFNF